MESPIGLTPARNIEADSVLSNESAGTFRPVRLLLIVAAVGLSIAKPFLLGEPPRPTFAFTFTEFIPSTLPHPKARRVGLDETKAAFDNGTALFLDVRGESEFAAGHIPGAVVIPVDDLQMRHDELDREQRILTYCA